MKKKSKYKVVKAQAGGFPKQEDYPDYESFIEAANLYLESLKQDSPNTERTLQRPDSLQTSTSRFKEINQEKLPIKKGLDVPSEQINQQPVGPYDVNQLKLSGTGGFDDWVNLAEGIGKIGNGSGGGAKGSLRKFFGVFNPAARIVTNTANKLTEIKNTKDEYKQYLKALQPASFSSTLEDGLNDNPVYTQYGGVVDYLNKHGINSSKENRKKIFSKYIKNYSGTADENIRLLNDLQSGKIKLYNKNTSSVGLAGQTALNTPSKKKFKNSDIISAKAEATAGIPKKSISGNPEIDYYIENELATGHSKYMIVNKADNTMYYGDGNEHKQLKVGLGKNTEITDSQIRTKLADIESFEKQGKNKSADKLKVTTIGSKAMKYRDKIYGKPGYILENSNNEAIHARYSVLEDPAEYARRLNLEKKGNYNYSYGCTNVDDQGNCTDGKSPLDDILSRFSKDITKPDTARYIDTRLPRERNKKALSIKQQGGCVDCQDEATPLVEAEQGEVYTTTNGEMNKVPESGRTHEQGGEILENVERVLEDTSDKRKDNTSKALKLSPYMAKLLADVDIKKSSSHSKVMEKAKEQNSKKLDKVQSKLNKNVDSLKNVPNNIYAKNSMDINLQSLNEIPTDSEVFDSLFDHQEFVKAALGVQAEQAKYGGKYGIMKAQVGLDNAKKLTNITGWNFLKKENGKNYFEKDGKITVIPEQQINVVKGGNQFTVDDILKNPNKYKTFHARMAGAPEDVKRQAAQQLLLKGVMPASYSTGKEYGYTQLPPVEPNDDITDTPDYKEMEGVTLPPGTRKTPNAPYTQPKSTFNEPLNWFDVAGPISGLLEGRIPVKHNPAQLNQLRLKLQNPLPALQSGQSDYNAALKMLPQNTVGQANVANVYSKKYAIDNQILGQYENANSQIKNKEIEYNTNVRDRQSIADQSAREVTESKYLGSKEALRQQQKTSWDEIYTRLAQNKKLNREGNLLMKLFPAFDQNADFNGYKYQFRNPLNLPKKS